MRMAVVLEGALACKPDEDAMGFEIRWNPAVDTTLMSLHDNLRLVAPRLTGRGIIAVRYCTPKATIHKVRWILIGDEPLSNLAATGQRGSGPPQPLDKAPGPQHKWSSNGVVK
jgi:hypothetical protein